MSTDNHTAANERIRSVFIVDDHPILCKGLTDLINQEPDLKVCGTAGEISAALDAIEDCNPDIVTVDITLGNISGIRLVEELAARQSNIPTLVLSVYDESLYAERCLRAGAKGYVMKSEPSEKVIGAVKKVLDGEISVSETLGTELINKLMSKQSVSLASPIDQLSTRELEVFDLLGRGLRTREIAEKLSLSIKTIETYIDHIKKKMNFRDSRHLFMHAVQWFLSNESE